MFLFLKVTETLFWEAWNFWRIFWPLYKHKVHLKGWGGRWSAQEPCVCFFVTFVILSLLVCLFLLVCFFGSLWNFKSACLFFMPSLPFWVFSFDLWHFLTACLFYCLFYGHLWHFESACPFVFFLPPLTIFCLFDSLFFGHLWHFE